MELRRDERGRPVGLAWPKAPEFTREVVAKAYKPQRGRSEGQNMGRPQQDTCKNGHDLSEWGRPIKAGGRYCAKCRAAYSKVWQAANPEKMKLARAKSKEKRNAARVNREQAPEHTEHRPVLHL